MPDLFMYIILIAIAIIVLSLLLFLKIMRRGRDKYKVFLVEEGEFRVQTAIEVKIRLEDIEVIEFSKTQRLANWLGIMQIIKHNGKRSRKFRFDSSYLHHKFILNNSEMEIDRTIDMLMQELKKYGLSCTKLDD